jgi:hypothetical protein
MMEERLNAPTFEVFPVNKVRPSSLPPIENLLLWLFHLHHEEMPVLKHMEIGKAWH